MTVGRGPVEATNNEEGLGTMEASRTLDGDFQARLILTVLYFVVVAPFALLVRFAGRSLDTQGTPARVACERGGEGDRDEPCVDAVLKDHHEYFRYLLFLPRRLSGSAQG